MSTPELERPRAPVHRGSRQDRRARRVLERDYERLRASTRSAVERKLARVGVRADPADVDPAYNLAWQALYAKLAAGDDVENPAGFLTQATFFRVVDEHRGRRGDRRDDVDPATLAAPAPDLEGHLDDARRLRELAEGMRARLDDRERRAAVLCYLHGFTREEAADALGIRVARMQKVMDRASKVVAGVVADVRDDAWCSAQRSLVTAYALGVLETGGPRHGLAREHLDGCPGCRARVLALRGLGAAVPPIALPWGALGAHAAQLPGLLGWAGAGTSGAAASSGAAGTSGAAASSGTAASAGATSAAAGAHGSGGLLATIGVHTSASVLVGSGLAAVAVAVGGVVAVSSGGDRPAAATTATAPGTAATSVAEAARSATVPPSSGGRRAAAVLRPVAARAGSAGAPAAADAVPVASGASAPFPAAAAAAAAVAGGAVAVAAPDGPDSADPPAGGPDASPTGDDPQEAPTTTGPSTTAASPGVPGAAAPSRPAAPVVALPTLPALPALPSLPSLPLPLPTISTSDPAAPGRVEVELPGVLGVGITPGAAPDPVVRLGP